jgi:hypothetical protein
VWEPPGGAYGHPRFRWITGRRDASDSRSHGAIYMWGTRGTLHASTPAAGDLSRDVDGADSYSGQYHNLRAENLAATGLRRR